MRRLWVSGLLGVVALAGCGSGSSATNPPVGAGERAALSRLQAVIRQAARPVKARPGYRISLAAARNLHGLDLWNAIVDPMIYPLTPLDGTAQLRTKLDGPQYTVYVLFAVDADYENGGLWQVYYNESGAFANEAVHMLAAIGAPLHGATVARANRVMWPTSRVPSSEAARRRVVTLADDPRFDAVNTQWARADAKEGGVETIIERYIRTHPGAFFS